MEILKRGEHYNLKTEKIIIFVIILAIFALFVFAESEFTDVLISGDLNVTGSTINSGFVNMTNNNITNADCIIFTNGGQICNA
ncbi:MAG: hypothetical protein Q8O68_00455 [Candidatus Daviesbacteria bacterium]|nr:hypothetical protein [Candidatus Daviesbacteria bacterium]